MRTKLVVLLLFLTYWVTAQSSDYSNWTSNEQGQYHKLMELGAYLYKKDSIAINRDTLLEKYVYFDHILKDTLLERKNKRLSIFNGLFYKFKIKLDSLGMENLDAKPVRFYKNHEIYDPFREENALQTISGEKMYTKDTNVFAYYKKEDEENPLGVLLLDEETHKLLSWVLMKQGRHHYFLNFNLF